MYFTWMESRAYGAVFSDSFVGKIKVVYSHSSGSNSAVVKYKYGAENLQTLTISGTFVSISKNTIRLGATGSKSQILYGTMNEYTIYSRVLSQSEIDDFFA